MQRIAYCPWCGSEVSILGYDVRLQQIEWTKCNAFRPCRGAVTTVITDMQGFIIYPFRLRGNYVFSRPKKQDR